MPLGGSMSRVEEIYAQRLEALPSELRKPRGGSMQAYSTGRADPEDLGVLCVLRRHFGLAKEWFKVAHFLEFTWLESGRSRLGSWPRRVSEPTEEKIQRIERALAVTIENCVRDLRLAQEDPTASTNRKEHLGAVTWGIDFGRVRVEAAISSLGPHDSP